MDNNSFIRQIEDEILEIDKRVAERTKLTAIENADDGRKKEVLMKSLKDISEVYGIIPAIAVNHKIDIDDNTHIGYPQGRDLFEKITFFEGTRNRVWRKNDLAVFLDQMGEKKFKKNEKNEKALSPKLHYYVTSKKLIKIKFGGSVYFTYYTTRPDWFLKNESNELHLMPEHCPPANELERLKNANQIEIKGME